MHSSTILVITSAALAFASPIEKRDAEDNGVFKRIANAWGNNGGQWGYTGYRWGASASSSSSSSTAVGSSSSVGSVTSVIVSATPTSTIQPSITQTPSLQIQTSTTLVQPSSTSIPSVPVQTTVTSATLQPTASVTATSSAAPSPSTLTDYASTVVHAHNVLRQKHTNTPNVTYDDNLAAYALTLAQTCVFAHDTSIGGGGYGQNLASGGSTSAAESLNNPSTLAADSITNGWYNNEVSAFLPSYYGQANPDMSNFAAWGHFSQLVWKSSVRIGCATHYCASGTPMFGAGWSGWYTVCNYGPPGNVGGEYGNNIGALL